MTPPGMKTGHQVQSVLSYVVAMTVNKKTRKKKSTGEVVQIMDPPLDTNFHPGN